ncbi:hypothetical protein [Lactiplantibacillus paraplantarum]|uniref:hypothetical protein n=1 Tax=Lactiplantibacillus paraplantarum TaxID=60520 RepID=UPI00040BBC62|nr:hypothetical protein [Lactiplantibacillus paraplantarum]
MQLFGLAVTAISYSTINCTKERKRLSAIRAVFRHVLGATEAYTCYANGLMPRPH